MARHADGTAPADGGAPLTEGQLALWARLEERVRQVLPAATVTGDLDHRRLTDAGAGIVLSFFATRLELGVDRDETGDDTVEVDSRRAVAAAVEHETGLTAYDRVTGRPFLVADAAPVASASASATTTAGAAPSRGDKAREPTALIVKVMLVAYALAAAVVFTPAGLIGAVLVIVAARLSLRVWWRRRQ